MPVEIIFDQSIGHIFVNRVAGNIATTEIIASIEYGVAVLGIKVIMVLGHRNCGAVHAAIDGKAVPGQISSLYRFIRPAVNQAGDDLRAATIANAKIQAQLLRESSPVLAELIKQGQLKVVAAYFDIEIGRVQLLRLRVGAPTSLCVAAHYSRRSTNRGALTLRSNSAASVPSGSTSTAARLQTSSSRD